MSSLSFSELVQSANAHGLQVLALTSASELEGAAQALKKWQGAGAAGEMKYMQRDSELLAAPTRMLPGAQTAVMFAVRYESAPHPLRPRGFARVARYAWGRDYHEVLRSRLSALIAELERQVGKPVRARPFSDAVPLMERPLAARAGLGFIGKNTMLIQRGAGSFFFIAEILIELTLTGAPQELRFGGSCGPCTRCLGDCPTGAITSPYFLDARRCISYLSIEKRGSLEVWEREALGEWIFGCDICQEVCPFNHRTIKSRRRPDLEEFSAERGTGPLLDLGRVIDLRTEAAFGAMFEGTPLLRPRREGLVRNALCVAVNTDARELSGKIATLVTEDSSAVIRQHALWAYTRLEESNERRRTLLERARRDDDERVSAEALRIVEGEAPQRRSLRVSPK